MRPHIEGDEMSQNKTPRKAISPSKERVIEGLVGGLSITAAAEANGVSRQTVHRWIREDYEFLAQFNATRTDLRNETEARLFALASEAIGAVENAIQQGDANVGLSILKGLGLLPGKQRGSGSESPSALRSQAATRKLLESI
jgi:transposase-like protein